MTHEVVQRIRRIRVLGPKTRCATARYATVRCLWVHGVAYATVSSLCHAEWLMGTLRCISFVLCFGAQNTNGVKMAELRLVQRMVA